MRIALATMVVMALAAPCSAQTPTGAPASAGLSLKFRWDVKAGVLRSSITEWETDRGRSFGVAEPRTGWLGGASIGFDGRYFGLNGDVLIGQQRVYEITFSHQQTYEFTSLEATAGFRANAGGWNESLQGLYGGVGFGVAPRFNATTEDFGQVTHVDGWVNATAVVTAGFSHRRFFGEFRYAIDLNEFSPAPPGQIVKRLFSGGRSLRISNSLRAVMFELLKRLFGRRSASTDDESGSPPDLTWIDKPFPDLSWMFPPSTVSDPAAWDKFWQDQISHDVAGFVHMFVRDGELVDVMRANGLKTILCVGNGISQEPRALKLAGFDVTALDISPFASKVAALEPPEEMISELVENRLASGGRVNFVTGDLMDQACCPGPFDVIIDRKTLQLWPEADRPAAIQAVANRLAARGIFYSHCHDGGWKPPAPRRHHVEPWFVEHQWPLRWGKTELTGRVAWTFTSTG